MKLIDAVKKWQPKIAEAEQDNWELGKDADEHRVGGAASRDVPLSRSMTRSRPQAFRCCEKVAAQNR